MKDKNKPQVAQWLITIEYTGDKPNVQEDMENAWDDIMDDEIYYLIDSCHPIDTNLGDFKRTIKVIKKP